MTDPSHELAKVCQELEQVEQQIESLLEVQSKLLQKKTQLKQLIRDDAKQDKSRDWEKTEFPWSKKLIEVRSSVFGINAFRPLQLQTMNATLSGKDCILIMPTGGGKSLCFQLPALISKGITLVVSPLVSLMEDQVMALERIKVKAFLLNASSSKEHVKYVQDNMTNTQCPFKMLYVTPEKLAKSKRFMAKLEKMYEAGLFSRLVIDEVHCCSQWGHDFRPDYKFLGVMRRQFPGVPILGLTATATSSVLQDVKKILGIDGCLVFRASFNRTNLFYEVRPKPTGLKNSVAEICKLISSRFSGQSGIIYCLTQKDTEEVAREMQKFGIKASCYHANMDAKHRSKTHTSWINNDILVVVATIAFGMGIDKPDVRFVIHHSMSKSMENYYQESGRAGRDDRQAYCILYAGFSDISRQSTMVFTEQTGLEKLYGMVEYAYDIGRCRRTLIACHFGETWDSSQCDMMCDHCNPRPGTATSSLQDVTELCRDVITIVDNAKHKDQRITALKLMESVMGRGAAILRVKSLGSAGMCRENIERLLIHMLLNGYLREDFHFTAYTTISYLIKGPKANLLSSADHKIKLYLQTSLDGSTKQKQSSKPNTTSCTTTKPQATIKPVFVNHKNSHFIPGGSGVSVSGSTKAPRSNNTSLNRTKRSDNKMSRKKRVIIDSDSDDDDLDFGDLDNNVERKKRKCDTDKVASNCIVINGSDIDDNTEHVDDIL